MSALLAKEGSWVFTSESVSHGHPDKICDQISDAFLDLCLKKNPQARVACEVMVSKNHVIIGGEFRLNGDNQTVTPQETEELIRSVVKDIVADDEDFHWQKLKIINLMRPQSPQIAVRVDKEGGAGDQGIMFGYATRETAQLMPATLHCAHQLLRRLKENNSKGAPQDMLGPDAKSQVTLRYDGRKPVAVKKVVISAQHSKAQSIGEVREILTPLMRSVFAENQLELPKTPLEEWFLVNPSGLFTLGGPATDAGLTGRKIIVDTYGGAAPHGGGAFSGKDPSKVDRSAAYAARYLAKNVVAAGLAEDCLIQVSYAIGEPKPTSFYLRLPQDAECNAQLLEEKIQEMFCLTPTNIRESLGLEKPIYQTTATFGHFGREPQKDGSFPWERTDLADELKKEFA
ncbi:MAG: methionine adenosyltransferase [Alphaproteobacteria bacterium]